MADIFLSYARADRERVGPIVALLESCGWSVWSDARINAGETWDKVIERELAAASCVVVAWSAESVDSRWVRSEASEGLDRGILVPAHLDAAKPPLEFKLVQSINLADWGGDASSPRARELIGAVGKLLARMPAQGGAEGAPSVPTAEGVMGLPRRLRWNRIKQKSVARLWATLVEAEVYLLAAWARLRQLRLPAVASRIMIGVIAGLLIAAPAVLWLWLSGSSGRSPQPVVTRQVAEGVEDAGITPVKLEEHVGATTSGPKQPALTAPYIKVPPSMVAESPSQSALLIEVGLPQAVPGGSFVAVHGLPPGISLSPGHNVEPGRWSVPRFVLPELQMVVPTAVSGRYEIMLSLRAEGGATLARSRTVLVVMSTATKTSAESYLKKGLAGLKEGRIAVARTWLPDAARAGFAEAAMRLAETYDTFELRRMQAVGVTPDRREARKWYQLARELGAPEAEERLARLGAE